jgi:Fe2+ transport system protein FeoA
VDTLIDLKDCKKNKLYEIVMTCDEPRFFEIGILPTQQIQLLKYQGGLYQVKVGETVWAVREEQGKCIKVKEI